MSRGGGRWWNAEPEVAINLLAGPLATLQVAIPVRTALAPSTDYSWMVDQTLAVSRHLAFGTGVLWPYGPLGFADHPVDLSRPLLAAALVHCLRRRMRIRRPVAAASVLALLPADAVLGSLGTSWLVTELILLILADLRARSRSASPLSVPGCAGVAQVKRSFAAALALLIVWSVPQIARRAGARMGGTWGPLPEPGS